jgi:hypothetical protein
MNVDDLLKNALNSGGKMLSGDSVFVLEGNVELKLLHVITLREAFTRNVGHFADGYNSGWLSLAVSDEEEELWRLAKALEGSEKSFTGNILNSKQYHVLQAQPVRNEIVVVTYVQFFSNNITAYTNNINRGWQMLGIYSDEETAKESIFYLRSYVRSNEGENLIRKNL